MTPTNPHDASPISLRVRAGAGAACCGSGAALVAHILTGSPLWLALVAIGFTASLTVVVLAAGEPTPLRQLSALGTLARRGIAVGLIGTAVYDSSRWVLAQVGGLQLSPFEAFPLFGQSLLGVGAQGPVVTMAGVAYHLLNGVAFGVSYVIWFGRRPWWWGIGFALGLEAFMLALYPGWLDPASVAELTQVSLVGHVAYGTTLGLLAPRLAPHPRLTMAVATTEKTVEAP